MSEIREQDFFTKGRIPKDEDETEKIEVLITSEFMKPARLWLPDKDKGDPGPWYAIDEHGWRIRLDRVAWRYAVRP